MNRYHCHLIATLEDGHPTHAHRAAEPAITNPGALVYDPMEILAEGNRATRMRVTKVYTRMGDKGVTRLVGGHEIDKSHLRVEAFGTVDELNSAVGLARSLLETNPPGLSSSIKERLQDELGSIQNWLFILGGDLATFVSERWPEMPLITSENTRAIEERLDAMNAELPPLEEFILPGGTPPAAALHLARSVCRRTERAVLRLSHTEDVGDAVIPFLNRLSDYLFVMARWIGLQSGQQEHFWRR